MNKIILFLFLLVSIKVSSQEKIGKPFITGSTSLSFGINENFVLFQPDDDEYFLDLTGIFFRLGFGYEFNRRVAISFNSGFDYHFNYDTSALPAYGSLKYNITERENDTFFVEISYGKMWRPSNKYPDGNYYGFGLGTQIAGEKRWNSIIRLDFHRKGIIGFEKNRIDSVSLGIGFSFF